MYKFRTRLITYRCVVPRGSFSWLKKMTAMPRPIAALTFSSVHTWYHVGWHVPNTKSAHWNQTRRNYLEQSKWKKVCIIRLSMVKSFKAVPIEDMCSPPQILRMEICSYSLGNAPHSVDRSSFSLKRLRKYPQWCHQAYSGLQKQEV